MTADQEGTHNAVVLDDLPVLSRPLKKRTMYGATSLEDPLSGRIVDQVVIFHLLQPVPFPPVAPDQYLARICQVTLKQIGTDVQKTVPISLPHVPGLPIESPGFPLGVVEIDLAILTR